MALNRSCVESIRFAVAGLNGGDIDAYLEQFDDSCQRWVAGFDQPLTLGDIRASLEQFHAAFEALHLREDALFGDESRVCARWRLCGRHVGEFMGLPASNREISVEQCEVYEFRDGKVATVWTYGDMGSLFRQIATDALEGDA